MAITREEVEYVANLSRLQLSEEELKVFGKQLNDILGYAAKLDELDTSAVEPMIYAIERQNVFREDRAQDSLPREEALSNAPDTSEGCFKVPRIID